MELKDHLCDKIKNSSWVHIYTSKETGPLIGYGKGAFKKDYNQIVYCPYCGEKLDNED